MTDANRPVQVRVAEGVAAGARWVRTVSTFVKVVLVLGGALLLGIAKFAGLPTTPFNYQNFLGVVGAMAAFVGGLLLILLDKDLSTKLVEAAEAVSELQKIQSSASQLGELIARAEERAKRSAALAAVARTLRIGVERTLSQSPNLEAATSGLLDLVLVDLQEAMALTSAEHWTISIYQAEGSPIVLRRIATRRSERLEERSASREWEPGEGHIGTTFSRKREVVLDDVNEPDIKPHLNTPPAKDLPTDAQRYRSIAAMPVLVDPMPHPWGVAIATSSRAGRFSYVDRSDGGEHAEAMRIFAGMIALAVKGQHILQRAPEHG